MCFQIVLSKPAKMTEISVSLFQTKTNSALQLLDLGPRTSRLHGQYALCTALDAALDAGSICSSQV